MRALTHRSHAWFWGLCLVVATIVLGIILTLPAVASGAEVDIDNFGFTPTELTVQARTTVVFRNRDDIPHLVAGAKGEFRSKGARYG